MKPKQLKLDSAWWVPMADPTDSNARQCPRCDQWRPLSEYPTGQWACRACFNKYQAARRHNQPDRFRAQRTRDLRKNYGLTHEQYDLMFAAQDGKCAACGEAETTLDNRTGETKWLVVDHDHVTGQVRALLCGGCNTAFGHLNEDPGRIAALLRYAERVRQDRAA